MKTPERMLKDLADKWRVAVAWSRANRASESYDADVHAAAYKAYQVELQYFAPAATLQAFQDMKAEIDRLTDELAEARAAIADALAEGISAEYPRTAERLAATLKGTAT